MVILLIFYNTYPLPRFLQCRIGRVSSSSMQYQRIFFALSISPPSSCALARANHASELSHPVPSLVKILSRPYARSLAAILLRFSGVFLRSELMVALEKGSMRLSCGVIGNVSGFGVVVSKALLYKT